MGNQSSFRKCISVDGADIRHSLPDGLNGAGHPTGIVSILSWAKKLLGSSSGSTAKRSGSG